MNLPNHIAIIMDGNGRWGKKKFNNRLIGHERGIENIKNIVEFCIKKKIPHLTVYALSKDNLKKRNKNEINNIFNLLRNYLSKNIHYFKKYKIKINFIGEIQLLPFSLREMIIHCSEELNKFKSKLVVNVAINYSSKTEILKSVKMLIKNKKKLNVSNIEKYLFTARSGHPEIIIRTGGYKRLSDFLLFQSSFTEFFFIDKLWPDLSANDISKLFKKFNLIERKFGL